MQYRLSKKPRSFFILSFLFIALPMIILLLGQRQEIRQHASSSLTGLHVSGNALIDDNGQYVHLRGVNRGGTAWACVQGWGFGEGTFDIASVRAMLNWHINVVRIPLNEDCWLGINGVNPTYSGINYQNFISNYVNLLNQYNIYAIVDLHWNAPGTQRSNGQQSMADEDHASSYWTSLANTFKGNRSVIFDLYNEPHPDNSQDSTAAWQCWRDGGMCPGVTFQAAGMQELVNTVRNTGAQNVIMLAGVNWADGFSQFLTYEPNDPLHNIIASWHIYPDTNTSCHDATCYDQRVGSLAQQMPLIASEVASCNQNLSTVLNWLDIHNAHYTAWAWENWNATCGSNWPLITDYSGTPESPYGINYKNYLASVATGVTLTSIPSSTPTPTYLTGDINHSGCINILDFNAWLQAYQGHPVTGTFPDVNGDGVIDILDFNSWLTTLQSIYNSNPNDPRLCTN